MVRYKFANSEKLVKDFARWCKVDKQLASRTIEKHVYNVIRYLNTIEQTHQIDTESMRSYLETYTGRVSYQDQLKALRRLSQFLNKPQLTESFDFPETEIKQVIAKSKEDLTTFYNSLPTWKLKSIFLLYATSGLRCYEGVSLTMEDIDFKTYMVVPRHAHETYTTKKANHSYFNEETIEPLKKYLKEERPYEREGNLHPETDPRVFLINQRNLEIAFRANSLKCGVKVLVSDLRDWFINEMGALNMQDRYVDFFCGRTPKSVLAKHYTDFLPQKTKPIYQRAGIRVLSESRPVMQEEEKQTREAFTQSQHSSRYSVDDSGLHHKRGLEDILP